MTISDAIGGESRLWHNRDFRRSFAGEFLTNTGDSLYTVGVLWLVFQLSGSTFLTGITNAILLLPWLIQIVAGPLIDRLPLKSVLVGSQVIQGIVVLVLPLAAITGRMNAGVVLAVVAVLMLATVLESPVQATLVPRIVADERLPRANSVLAMVTLGLDMMFEAVGGAIIALFGGVLPLAAWLYRDYLSRDELICLAFLLSVNPILVHYSRFARSDILVATFMFTALGFLLRAYHTDRTRYVAGSAARLALGMTTKENFLLYLAAWTATSLLFYTRSNWRHPDSNESPPLKRRLKQLWPREWVRKLGLATIVYLGIVLELYLPRNVRQPSLWTLILAPENVGRSLPRGCFLPLRPHSRIGYSEPDTSHTRISGSLHSLSDSSLLELLLPSGSLVGRYVTNGLTDGSFDSQRFGLS